MILGAHVSTAGGLERAPGRGASIAAEAIQIFTRNQVQWQAKPISAAEARAFRAATERAGLRAVVAHGSYLINLSSPDRGLRDKSRRAFVADMRRCEALGISHLIFHPGAHVGAGEARGLATIARSLDHILRRTRGLVVRPLLEVTAGQGTVLGYRFEQLASIIDRLAEPERVGVCLDTCHLLAAGYDLATASGYRAMLRELESTLGVARVEAFHLNDAVKPLGSRVDRHAPIGRGCVGRDAFARLVRDRRFRDVPAVLETPGGLPAWSQEIALLRRLARRRPAA